MTKVFVHMNRRILFLSSASWNFIWQRHHELAVHLSKTAHVFFVENTGANRKISLRDVRRIYERLKRIFQKNAHTHQALPEHIDVKKIFLFPPMNRSFEKLNSLLLKRWLLKEIRGTVDVIYFNLINKVNAEFLKRFPEALKVYDNIGNYPAHAEFIHNYFHLEKQIIAETDVVLTDTYYMLNYYSALHRNVHYFPSAAQVGRFTCKRNDKKITGRTLLYFGHISRFHFDQELIRETAVRHADWKIVLVGPVKDKYTFPKNVEAIGQVQHQELIRYIEKADVLCMPYRKNDVMKGVFPAKTFECLATGLPTVVINVPELEKDYSDVFYIAHSNEEFITLCETAMDENDLKLRELRQKKANANTWEIRCQQFDAILEDAMLQKRGVRA